MHTRNVNVKTAAQESSGRCEESKTIDLTTIREMVRQYSIALKDGVEVTQSEVSRYGDVQIEIRQNGGLVWRAWSFQPDFMWELESNLELVQQK
jgi:hypothetical protein